MGKNQRRMLNEGKWVLKILNKAKVYYEGNVISKVGYDIIVDYANTNTRKNQDTFQAYMEYQFRTNNKLLYDEYQVIVDMVLLGK